MKVNASLLTRMVEAPRASQYAQKLAARIEPGQFVSFANGSRLRVLQKNASQGGMRFVFAGKDKAKTVLSFRQFAELGPVSPAMLRLAVFVRRAFDPYIDTYVKEAIKAAGYPVDPTMNWSKYLDRMYKPLVAKLRADEDVVEDAIREVVVHELYQKKILDPNSTHSHFDPDHAALAGKDLANKVSAFLVNIFKFRKDEVVENVKRALGVGAKGNVGLMPADSLDAPANPGDEEPSVYDLADQVTSHTNHDIEDLEGNQQVHEFLNDFRKYVRGLSRMQNSAPTLIFISQAFEKGMTKSEIRDRIIGNPKFQGRKGEPLDLDGYNFAMNTFGRLIRAFAKDPEQGWAKTSVARLIVFWADRLEKDKKERKKTPEKALTSASLRLADFAPNDPNQPQQPNMAQNTATPPPPPPNPNVQQQNTVKQQQQNNKGLNTAQPANDEDENGNQQHLTIPPEIPGVNHTTASLHTASEEEIMPTTQTAPKTARPSLEQRIQQRRLARKFATLRRIAEQEPEAVGEALNQLSESFEALAEKLDNLEDHLDVAELPKEASIRQKVAHRNTFARELKRLASENPQEIENALNDFYSELNSVVTDVETLADNLGVTLEMPSDEPPAEPTVVNDLGFDEPKEEKIEETIEA